MANRDENEQLNEIWLAAKERIREDNDFPDTIIRLWFDDMKLDILTDDTAVFHIRSDFKRDVIRSRFLRQIKEGLTAVIGFPVEVTVKSMQSDLQLEKKLSDGSENRKDPTVPEKFSVGSTSVINRAAVPSALTDYTFENFVVGSSNQFAYATSLAVADNPKRQYNPLFIYGPSGLGKTHLLYAITDRIRKNHPDYHVVYVKGEDFMNQMVDAIGKRMNAEFRKKYRSVDVLLIDDIQVLAGRDSTQLEFFNTFNELYENDRQIILASDRPPRDIKLLDERLRTRFESGITADVDPPDLDLRIAILRSKAAAIHLELPEDIINYIAENLRDNVRQLEGAVKKISAQSLLSGSDINMDLAIRCISDRITPSEPVNVTVERIMSKVAVHYGVSVEDIKGKKRTSNISLARHVTAYIIKELTDRALMAIGREMNRTHATIINSIDTVEKRMSSDPDFNEDIKDLIRSIRER